MPESSEKQRQYVAIVFKGQGNPYTYHNDGDPVQVGDFVKIPGRYGSFSDSWQRCEVVSLSDVAPAFKTKAILGIAPPLEEKQGE